jgi:hypothetical protein
VHRVPEAVLAPGARIECRSAEWLVRGIGRSSDGQQVVDVVGVRFAGKGLNVVAVEPFEAVATSLQLGSRDLANISGEEPPEHLSSQLRFAVERANTYLRCATAASSGPPA